MKKGLKIGAVCTVLAAMIFFATFAIMRARFPRPYAETVKESGLDPHLVYGMIKAESGFRENSVSRAGAVGLMQLLPSTAEFICEHENVSFDETKLFDGEYNLRLGTLYLKYLLGRFPVTATALAAYNAGEGTVSDWLADRTCSEDGTTLQRIPYAETENYIKKVIKFKKIYDFFY